MQWFPYDPAARVDASIEPAAERATFEIALAADGDAALHARRRRALRARAGIGRALRCTGSKGYGGGLWLPFADATTGVLTYGGGRYLYDTIKGADLGVDETSIVLDFNYAYHPSCAYDERWSCPLAPPENRLGFAVEAGERLA